MSVSSPLDDPRAATERALAVKRLYTDQLMSKPNVVGVGIGFTKRGGISTDQIGLVVMVERKLPSAQLDPSDLIPREIEGVPVDVQEVGEIRAY